MAEGVRPAALQRRPPCRDQTAQPALDGRRVSYVRLDASGLQGIALAGALELAGGIRVHRDLRRALRAHRSDRLPWGRPGSAHGHGEDLLRMGKGKSDCAGRRSPAGSVAAAGAILRFHSLKSASWWARNMWAPATSRSPA